MQTWPTDSPPEDWVAINRVIDAIEAIQLKKRNI